RVAIEGGRERARMLLGARPGGEHADADIAGELPDLVLGLGGGEAVGVFRGHVLSPGFGVREGNGWQGRAVAYGTTSSAVPLSRLPATLSPEGRGLSVRRGWRHRACGSVRWPGASEGDWTAWGDERSAWFY